ncbi:MAG: RAMP superfamily CRISPR-associated protein [Eubacteriales bacterium]|nr:RAMP superfamily CRISPR-associated protein [Eubacteriales bacterium]
MKKWNLKIKLKSDLCTATGENAPGITNIKTAMENGIPYIPAKRIKGCLVNEGKEMRDNGLIDQSVLEGVFGKTGAARAEGIFISDAHLCSVPGYLFEDENQIDIDDYKLFQMEVQRCESAEKEYFEGFFTRMRTHTAMDSETGAVKNHSLRTIQVVPAGFHFVCSLVGELNQKEEDLLLDCVKGLRHMGMGITRGLGEVQCELERVSPESNTFQSINRVSDGKANLLYQYNPEEEVILSYELNLNSPVVIDGTGNCIPGSTMLGALAGMYIQKYSLGGNAHKDEDFSRIFLHDDVQFGYGFPKRNGKIYFPCPRAVAEMKEDEGKWFHIEKDKERKRKDVHGLVWWEGKKMHVVSPPKELHFHHSRPIDRGIGHAVNERAEDTTIPTGEFFNYTALSKGQSFAGTWGGKAKDILRLVKCLQDCDYRMRLGKSRTAEYGNCSFKIIDINKKVQSAEDSRKGTKWMLWFLTPMISRDRQTGEYILDKAEFENELKESLGCNVIELRKVAVSSTTYSGYNSKWRLPSVSYPAIDLGSTYYLETDREINSCDIEDIRWGTLVGNGCGQAAVRLWDKSEEGEIVFDQEEVNHVENGDNGLIDRLRQLREVQLECEKIAMQKLDGIREGCLPPSSAISLLSQLLRRYANSKDFYDQIKNKVEHINKAEKRQRILKFIEPCEGETYGFMKLYLENAKWKARCRSKDE